MRARKLADLPIPQSGCGNTRLCCDGLTLELAYEYRCNGKDMIGVIRFEEVVAYRFRNEINSGGYLSEAYEAIAEALDSSWQTELTVTGVRHFAVFLSSNGYFEFLASSYSTVPPSEGLLP